VVGPITTLPDGPPMMTLDSLGEPIVKTVGQSHPGLLPPMSHNRPELPNQERFWFSAGYLVSFMRNERLATPLATTGSLGDLHPAGLGQPGTAVLFGGDPVNFGAFSGVRLGAGVYCGDEQHWSLGWSGFYYFPNTVNYATRSDAAGNPIIARPIFDVVNGFERAFVDSLPGLASGGINIHMRSQLWGTEVNAGYHCCLCEGVRLGTLFGFRYMRLAEDLRISDALTPLQPNNIQFAGTFINPGDVLTDQDRFSTVNHFYGMQVGSQLHWEGERFFADAFGKLAFGATHQRVDINGATALFPGGTGVPQITPGGLLALPSNSGTHTRTTFGFVPEVGLDLGVRLTPHVRLSTGYSFLYWNQVMRPGDVINRAVNPSMVPSSNTFATPSGQTAPLFVSSSSPFWINTFSFMLDITY
jgi:hypothetical protein